MEWQQILGFYQVARLGSFTKAAEATLRTQSALSQQIKALEEEFDSPFFDRIGRRKLKLTPSGEKFLQFAELVLEGYENLKEVLDERGLPKGSLKIAAPFTTLYHLFPERVKHYLQQFPNVELTLLDRPQEIALKLVRDGDVDFGVALESLVPRDLEKIRWKMVESVLIVPRDHPLLQERDVTWKRIAAYPLILPPRNIGNSGRMHLEGQLRKLRIAYRIAMESSNVELSAVYVEMGLGISFATIVKDLPVLGQKKVKTIPLGHYFKPDYVSIVTRKGKAPAMYKNAFLNALFEDENSAQPIMD